MKVIDFKNAFSDKFICLLNHKNIILAMNDECKDIDEKFNNEEVIDIFGGDYYEINIVINFETS